MSMAQKIQDKIIEISDLIDGGKDVVLCIYKKGEKSQIFYKGRADNLITQVASTMASDNRFALIVEEAGDAYTAYKLDEKLKNKEI